MKQKDASQIANNVYENKFVAAEIESQNQESGRARKMTDYSNPKAGYREYITIMSRKATTPNIEIGIMETNRLIIAVVNM